MRNDANYEDETTGNANQPKESARVSDEAITQGRDVRDTSREGATQGADVIEDDAATAGEVEILGRTVIDRSREAATHGVDVIDEGPLPDSTDEDANH